MTTQAMAVSNAIPSIGQNIIVEDMTVAPP
jgi:hypothetical protein